MDNLLNFCGGAVGSGLAVIATLWLERRKRERALEQMLNSLVIVADASLRFRYLTDELILPMALTFQQGFEALEASRLGVTITNPLHQYAFHSAMFWVKRSMDEIKVAVSDKESGRISEDKMISVCRESASHVFEPIQDFLDIKGLPVQPKASLKYAKAARELEALNYAAHLA
ncbi:hypothetical protein [Sphingomonas sp. OTU376]|uniref:hypothetical protein n=1 Tax=Sphingomonas sp. OTU376 TaxID=3043863 RepID=UPI00313B2892